MKRLLISAIILIAFFLVNCESEKVIPGESGSPVYLVPEIETSSDTLGCTFSWSFMERPLHSNLSILSFQPSSNGYNIYFIPDVAGDYKVKCEVLTPDQKINKETIFLCKIKGDTEGMNSTPSQEIQSEDNSQISDSEPIYLEDESTPKPTKLDEQPKPAPAKPKPQIVKQKTITEEYVEEGIFTIQISSFRAFQNAEKELKELKSLGLEDVYIKRVHIPSLDQTWFRVRTNSFQDRASAREKLTEIKTKYKRSSAWIDKVD